MSVERRPRWRRAVRTGFRVSIVLLLGLPILAVATASAGFGLLLFGDLPGTVPDEKPPPKSEPSHVYDVAGNEIATFREYDLTVSMVKEDVPQVLKDAVVAAEDHKFWSHKGVDPEGLVRAGLANYQEGTVVQGGSTITQQYVKSAYLTNERSISRKLNEAVLATRVERDLTDELGSTQAAKEEILFRYLNTTYFGGGAYGAGAAAETYFRKNVRDLTVSEAALLASVIPAPSRYGPRENPNLAELRRQGVLGEMRDQGFITDAQYTEALGQQLWLLGYAVPDRPATGVYPPPDNGASQYPYFVDYVRQYLLDRYGPEQVFRGGLQVHTTIDPNLQALADASVANSLKGTSAPLEMSLVSVEPATGYVKALVGGRDFNASQVNLALGGSAGMQPGSAFKAFTLASALEQGFGVNTSYNAGGSWTVPNCTGKCVVSGGGGGYMDMRAATAGSVNTYFAQLVYDVGPNKVAELANRLGVSRITTDRNYGVSLTLGAYEVSPLDMAAGYATLANHGVRADVTPVITVAGGDGVVIEDNSGPRGTAVLDPAVADTVTDLLRGVINGGTGTRANIGRPAAGKTGTAEDNRAAWFVGYVPQLVTAVWMGYSDEPRPLLNIGGFGQVMGGTVPAKTWADYMRPAVAALPPLDFPQPGVLPAPKGDNPNIRTGIRRGIPQLAGDCGGPCVKAPSLPSPVDPPTPDTSTPTTTTTTTTASSATTTTTKKGTG